MPGSQKGLIIERKKKKNETERMNSKKGTRRNNLATFNYKKKQKQKQ